MQSGGRGRCLGAPFAIAYYPIPGEGCVRSHPGLRIGRGVGGRPVIWLGAVYRVECIYELGWSGGGCVGQVRLVEGRCKSYLYNLSSKSNNRTLLLLPSPSQPRPQTRRVSPSDVSCSPPLPRRRCLLPPRLSVGPHPIPHPQSVSVSVSSSLGSSVSHDGSFAVYAKLWARGKSYSGWWGEAGGDREGQGWGWGRSPLARPAKRHQSVSTPPPLPEAPERG